MFPGRIRRENLFEMYYVVTRVTSGLPEVWTV